MYTSAAWVTGCEFSASHTSGACQAVQTNVRHVRDNVHLLVHFHRQQLEVSAASSQPWQPQVVLLPMGPFTVAVIVARSAPPGPPVRACASPKSATLTHNGLTCITNTLSARKSRWSIPCMCRWRKPRALWARTSSTKSKLSGCNDNAAQSGEGAMKHATAN